MLFRSPLIIAQPGLTPAGKVCNVPVNAPDLVATFAAQAGVKIPWATHGRDLTPLLKDPAAAWPHPCLYEFTGENYGSSANKEWLARKAVEAAVKKAVDDAIKASPLARSANAGALHSPDCCCASLRCTCWTNRLPQSTQRAKR